MTEQKPQFRVQTSLSPASAVQVQGALVDVITKSGSKSFHGNAFEFLFASLSDSVEYYVESGAVRSKTS